MAVHTQIRIHRQGWAKNVGVSEIHTVTVVGSDDARPSWIGSSVVRGVVNFLLVLLRPASEEAVIHGYVVVDPARVLVRVRRGRGCRSEVVDEGVGGRGRPVVAGCNFAGDRIHQASGNNVGDAQTGHDISGNRIADVLGSCSSWTGDLSPVTPSVAPQVTRRVLKGL